MKKVGFWASLEDYMRETRRSYIAKVLRACHSDREIAARVLEVTEAELD
ncbi:MAG: hypothetical protein ACKVI3_11910 [Verrucomicrobiia bacterium]